MTFQPTLRMNQAEPLTWQQLDNNLQGLADAIVSGSGIVFNSFADMLSADLTKQTHIMTKSYYTGQNKGGGVFIKTSTTGTVGENNGGSYFHDTDGNKWVLQHNGNVSTDQFGFVADYDPDLDTGTDNSLKLLGIQNDDTINKVIGSAGKYYFGLIQNSVSSVFPAKAKFNRSIDIDWQGAEIFMGLTDENAANQSGCFIAFFDSYSAMRNFEFTHIGWDRSKALIGNRGIFPLIISSPTTSTKDIKGFELENVTVWRGQGLFTASAGKVSAGYNYQASGITLKGKMYGDEVYYGCSLFHSGNNITGKYTLKNFIRSFISYDASDVDLEIVCTGSNQATSAALLPYTTGDRPSRNIKIKGWYAEINGPISPTAEFEAGDLAEMDNWDIDVYVDTLGDNMTSINSIPMRLGAVSIANSVYQETGTYKVKQNCKFRIRTGRDVVVNNYFYLQTTSPNIKPIYVDARNFDVSSVKHQRMLWYTPNGLQIGHRGNLESDPLTFSLRDALDKKISPAGLFSDGNAMFTVSGVPTDNVFKKFWLRGSLTSDEKEVVQIYHEYESYVEGAYNPTIDFMTDVLGSDFVTVEASAGGNAEGRHIFTFRQLIGGSINS